MRPLEWMRAVRDAEPKRPAKRLAVLYSLALRMRPDGTGFASAMQLANDARVHRATVARATADERKAGYLEQTRRGHRISAETVVASEWRLTQPDTGDPLDETQRRTSATLDGDPTSQTGTPNVANTGTQRRTSATPRGLSPGGLSPNPAPASANGAAGDADDGGREAHKHEPNARAALSRIRVERALPFTEAELLDLAYRLGPDPYYDGYRKIDAATQASFANARDPAAVLRKRLGLAS